MTKIIFILLFSLSSIFAEVNFNKNCQPYQFYFSDTQKLIVKNTIEEFKIWMKDNYKRDLHENFDICPQLILWDGNCN